ncbi:class I SAM-dependent methyltransferase [Paucibacter sp. APW11]|uniref:Class I SAM-dependent methyltransferase n=1 Tax=Roseateles aquae TaxID=3077235 RepID=A0ABU3P9Q4_9BURK|nr:class I SAM-dependent methyltransferase [Paucibacter sp. APW11]MDT8998955.1 class I SAM-dependent methyltransferase [Paucibacter sp. APW11]
MLEAPTRPSPWLLRWQQAAQPGHSALDLACGSGRHLRWLAARGLQVTGVDRDAAALAPLAGLGSSVELINADIEAGPWPLAGRQFNLVLVSNYLWRPLLAQIVASVAPGGWLIYETFAHGQQSIGRPARADFLLQPGELLQACAGLRVIGYEDGFDSAEARDDAVNGRYVQRVAAVREVAATGGFPRYPLVTAGKACASQ